VTAATTNARLAATANRVLSQALQDADVAVQHGAYHYDSASEKFVPQIPPVAPDPYNLTQVTVTRKSPTVFARVLNVASFDVTATATAAHRPRDVTLILDYSGSMNNESDLWNCEAYLGSFINTPNNTDPVVPQFGHYASAAATLVCTSTDPRVGKCNV